MKTNQPYPEESKIEAVKQITERGQKVAEVSARIGVSQHSLCKWPSEACSRAIACPRLSAMTNVPTRESREARPSCRLNLALTWFTRRPCHVPRRPWTA